MPFGGLLTAGIGSAIGGIAGAFGGNTRPPTLDPTQRTTLDSLIKNLYGRATGTPTIDPIQQALMYGNIAASRTGADTGLTHALVSRGLGRSGLLGAGLIQNQNQATQAQNQANLGLQQQAIGQQNFAIQSLLPLLNTSNLPGQTGAGGFLAGLAPLLAYSLQNSRFGGGGGGSGFDYSTAGYNPTPNVGIPLPPGIIPQPGL